MAWEIKTKDKFLGYTETIRKNSDGIVVNHKADVSQALDLNAARRAANPKGFSPTKEWQFVASVPAAVIQLWNNMYGVNVLKKENSDLFASLVDDFDNKYLKVADTTLGSSRKPGRKLFVPASTKDK
jgi:hypothetical protein